MRIDSMNDFDLIDEMGPDATAADYLEAADEYEDRAERLRAMTNDPEMHFNDPDFKGDEP